MFEGGEDPLFIARRLVRYVYYYKWESSCVSNKLLPRADQKKFTQTFCIYRIASEDVGLGDSNALGVAVAAMQGCQLIGRPECDVILAQCTVYLARAQKSHEVYRAMTRVKELIKDCDNSRNIPAVPLHLRNSTSSLERSLGYGSGYSYDLSDVKEILYMPEELKGQHFF